MAVLRLANGSDVGVKLTVEETLAALSLSGKSLEFVELPGDEGPIHVRPAGVIAVIEDSRRGTAGFRVGLGRAASE